VRVVSTSGSPLPALPFGVRLQHRDFERFLTLTGLRHANDALLVIFAEIRDRDQAQALAGAMLALERSALPASRAGEVYVFELEGATVLDEEGRALGVVRRVLQGCAQDLLEIGCPEGERLLPFLPHTVLRWHRETRSLVVRLIPGLWEAQGGTR
jgi:16S rRNA processing protein RimM